MPDGAWCFHIYPVGPIVFGREKFPADVASISPDHSKRFQERRAAIRVFNMYWNGA